jgi:membrane protein YqaA with SNARE-associated domain
MNFQELLHLFGPHVATAIVAFFSGFLPFINIELYMVVAGAMLSDSFPAWTLGVAAGFGQMIAKSMLFWSGSSALHSRTVRRFTRDRIDRLTDRMRGMNPWVLNAANFASALVGVPPFLLVSILAGVIRMKFWQFYLTGLVGRSLRLVIIVEFPHVLRKIVW